MLAKGLGPSGVSFPWSPSPHRPLSPVVRGAVTAAGFAAADGRKEAPTLVLREVLLAHRLMERFYLSRASREEAFGFGGFWFVEVLTAAAFAAGGLRSCASPLLEGHGRGSQPLLGSL